ncbi:MAG: DNA-processing protein DprA [Acidimicrobiales bacterium]
MNVTSDQRRLLALCAIRVERESVDWSLIAREAQLPDGLESLWEGSIHEKSGAAVQSREILRRGIKEPDSLLGRVDEELGAAEAVGAHLVTVLDQSYPANLRLIPNLPPFLFVRGDITEADVRSVAVVGTRQPSEAGLRRARRMAHLLAQQDVTVVSGLARGIDTAAHRTSLEQGGRTIAVLGTGITKCYPSENRELAEEITTQGALVSQFWPTRSAGRDTFPRRNVVTSGLSQGTVVIEATSTSGAKMQARLALEHGKKVFLVSSLVTDQQWARDYVRKRGAIEVEDVDEVVRLLAPPERVRQAGEQRLQLTFAAL